MCSTYVLVQEDGMDFIEKLFGVSPDGGSGLFEAILFVIPVIGIISLWAWRYRGKRDRN